MSEKTTTFVTCDICNTEIGLGQIRVYAGTYGLDFHDYCLEDVDGTIIGLLTDEIRMGLRGVFDDKPNHAGRYHWNKSIRGKA